LLVSGGGYPLIKMVSAGGQKECGKGNRQLINAADMEDHKEEAMISWNFFFYINAFFNGINHLRHPFDGCLLLFNKWE
jgi:hypothetical protein